MRSNNKAGVFSLCFDAKTESSALLDSGGALAIQQRRLLALDQSQSSRRADLQIPIGSFNQFELAHFINFLHPFAYVSVTHRSPLIQQQLRITGGLLKPL